MITSSRVLAGKRGLDDRLTSTQILLQQQEDAVKRVDRERRALADRVRELERSLHTAEMEKKHTQVETRSCVACTHLNSVSFGSALAQQSPHEHMAALNSGAISRSVSC